jgi:hypothetical protein
MVSLTWAGAAEKDKKWNISLYGGQFSNNALAEILVLRNKFNKACMAAVALNRELWRSEKKALGLELEGQAAMKWGHAIFEDDEPSSGDPGWDWAPGMSYESQNSGHSSHQEFNILLILRWHRFPWDRCLDTSFAIGEGISYATRVPAYEKDPHGVLHGSERKLHEASGFLNYLMLEFDFTRPEIAPWSLFVRIHHRSGAFGLFNDVHGGSNFVCSGFRYRFDMPAIFGN